MARSIEFRTKSFADLTIFQIKLSKHSYTVSVSFNFRTVNVAPTVACGGIISNKSFPKQKIKNPSFHLQEKIYLIE